MKVERHISALLVEMLGSAAICGVTLATDLLLGVRRRRHPTA